MRKIEVSQARTKPDYTRLASSSVDGPLETEKVSTASTQDKDDCKQFFVYSFLEG